MERWPYTIEYWSPEQIQKMCVQAPAWQILRKAMKGVPTRKKLDMLAAWRYEHTHDGQTDIQARCQIDNYINALKRGGQLHMDLTIKREL